jgi:hypothetical protein
MAQQARQYDAAFAHHVLPALEQLSRSLGTGTPDEVLTTLAHLSVTYHGTPQFTTIAEFNDLMKNESFTLNLTGR